MRSLQLNQHVHLLQNCQSHWCQGFYPFRLPWETYKRLKNLKLYKETTINKCLHGQRRDNVPYWSLRTLAMDWQPPGTTDCIFKAIFGLWRLCRRCTQPCSLCSSSETLTLNLQHYEDSIKTKIGSRLLSFMRNQVQISPPLSNYQKK